MVVIVDAAPEMDYWTCASIRFMQPVREGVDWMHEAYREHGYTMRKIFIFWGLYHSTVSRAIKSDDENAQDESFTWMIGLIRYIS